MFFESDIIWAASKTLKKLGYSEIHPQVVREFVLGHNVFMNLLTGISVGIVQREDRS